MATVGYARVSTGQQTSLNQRREIEKLGYVVSDELWFTDDGVSGKVRAGDRPGFRQLMSKIRRGETLIVTKIDRLGRDTKDILQTLQQLSELGIAVKVLQLGDLDLASSAGKLMVTLLSAVAEMERDLLVERTLSGLARVKATGKRLGRPRKLSLPQRNQILMMLAKGSTVSSLAREFSVSRATVVGIRAADANRATLPA